MSSDQTSIVAPSVVRSGRNTFVAGLQWQWVSARGARRLRVEAREQFASHWVSVPVGTADEAASMLGLLTGDEQVIARGKRLASLTLALRVNVPSDCWGVFALPSGQWWFMAIVGGHPSPFGDVTGDAVAVSRAVESFVAAVPSPPSGWVVFDPDSLLEVPEARRDALLSLIPKNSPSNSLLRKTDSKTISRAVFGLVVLAAVGWGVNQWMEGKRKAEHDAWVQAELIRAQKAAKAKPESLTRPWSNQPAFANVLNACIHQWQQAPLSIAGWVFRQAICESKGELSLHYALPDGGTVGDFNARLPELYGPNIPAIFNMPGPSDDASFVQKIPIAVTQPEDLLPGDEQLRRMTSYAQRLRANLRISPPEGLTQTVGQDKVPLPWKRYSFTFITDIPPDRLFDESRFKGNGIRLSTIKAELHGSRLTYTLEGTLYAEN